MAAQANPQNTPFQRLWRKYKKQGLSDAEAIHKAYEKWPNTREVVCYISTRRHRSAFIELAKELVKRGLAIDYEYRGQKEMRSETGDPTAEARGSIELADRTTPLPDDLMEKIAEKYDLYFDCYDDRYIANPTTPVYIVPPKAAQKIAKQALERRAKLPKSKRGGLEPSEAARQGITSGVAQAKKIAAGKKIDARQVYRFFQRFKGIYATSVAKGKSWDDAKVQQAWDLWGGTPMRKAAEKAVAKAGKGQKIPVGFTLDNPKYRGTWPPTRPLPYKKLVKGLKAHGWTPIREGKGSHDIWQAPTGINITIPRRRGKEPVGQPFLREIGQAEAGVLHERSRGRRNPKKEPGVGAHVAYHTVGLADKALGAYETVTEAMGQTAHDVLAGIQAKTGVKQNPWQEQLPGGLSAGMSPGDFDPAALREGIRVEMEHTDDRSIAMEIAMDHLVEDPAYYAKLQAVEGKKSPYKLVKQKPKTKKVKGVRSLVAKALR